MNVRTLLALGRVSNLPTVWTNVLAGAALSGGPLHPSVLVTLGLAGSLLYVGGMFLNDAFDRAWDARERPERPIPSGRASAPTVFAAGFGLLAAGVLGSALSGWAPAAAALLLAGLIVFYDAFHKAHPASVLVMAACRVVLYGMAALAVGGINRSVVAGACLIGFHVVALSVIARHESGRPGWPRLVGRLIAGICLLDALMILLAGRPDLAALAVLGFPATLWAQRYVKGT